MHVAIILPLFLHQAVSYRLRGIPSQTFEISLVDSEASHPMPKLQSADGLLIIQCRDFDFAQKTGSAAENDGILYGEIALHESPFAEQYGFMVAAGGKAESLQALTPILNALAPQPNAWWHVGHAGSACFLLSIQGQLSHLAQNPINVADMFPQLQQIDTHQQYAGQMAKKYLGATTDERFTPALTHQFEKCFASFINNSESPARQIARLISTLDHS